MGIPITLVPKLNSIFRLYADYHKLNSLNALDTYPLPKLDDIIDEMGKVR